MGKSHAASMWHVQSICHESGVGDHPTFMFFYDAHSLLLHGLRFPSDKKILSQCAHEAGNESCKPLYNITAHDLTMSISIGSHLCRGYCVCTCGFPHCNGFQHTVNLFECFQQFRGWVRESDLFEILLAFLTFFVSGSSWP